MMTGDNKNEGKKLPARRIDYDDLDIEGTSPVVVHTQSRKMSIYGPKFSCGPIQLRRQRLLEKAKKDAEATIAKKIEQMEAESKAEEEKRKYEMMQKQQAAMQMERFNDENTNGVVNQYQNDFQYQGNSQYQNNIQYQNFNQYQDVQQYQEFNQYQEFQQYDNYNQYPEFQQYPQQYPEYNNFYANKS